jgi:hypothetical protein
MTNFLKKFIRCSPLIATITVVFMLTACATDKSARPMKANLLNNGKTAGKTVVIKVIGGGKDMVSNDYYAKMLKQMILDSKAFGKVVDSDDADYRLQVILTRSTAPVELTGLHVKKDVVADWRLTDLKSKKSVFQSFVSATYTASMGDGFAGWTRERKAYEGAAQNNIQGGLEKMAKSDF